MGMSGMNVDAYVKYASTDNKKIEASNAAKSNSSSITVAQYRNMINHITKYYDNWSFDSFIKDNNIPAKTKIAAIYGKLFTDIQDESTWKTIISKAIGG